MLSYQDFLSRKRHFAAKGGQCNLQELHFRADRKLQERESKGSSMGHKRRSEQFLFRYTNFRDILVAPGLLYGVFVERTAAGNVMFRCSGRNHTITHMGGRDRAPEAMLGGGGEDDHSDDEDACGVDEEPLYILE